MTQNNTNIEATIATLNEKFTKLAKATYTIPNIIKVIAELGAENVFFIAKNYHGRYEDDECWFTYWDNVNGKIISDYWTTSYACPSFDLYYEDILTVAQAREYNLINMDAVKKHNAETILSIIGNRTSYTRENIEIIKKYNPLIKVEGGRKFRGMAYYITEIETVKHPYPAKVEAKVLSLDDFQIHYCNPKYVQFVEMEKIVKAYIEWVTEAVNKAVKNNNYSSFFNIDNDITWGIKDEFTFESYVKSNSQNIDYLLANAYDPRLEERKKQLAELRAKKYVDILNWVKTKTDKTTEAEQIELALKILNKQY